MKTERQYNTTALNLLATAAHFWPPTTAEHRVCDTALQRESKNFGNPRLGVLREGSAFSDLNTVFLLNWWLTASYNPILSILLSYLQQIPRYCSVWRLRRSTCGYYTSRRYLLATYSPVTSIKTSDNRVPRGVSTPVIFEYAFWSGRGAYYIT